jgi:predicted O-methyltransferase YrrM
VEEAYKNDPQTIGIKQFNDIVANDPRVEKFIFPLRDGLTLIKRIG